MASFCENGNKIKLPDLRSLEWSYIHPYVGPFSVGLEHMFPGYINMYGLCMCIVYKKDDQKVRQQYP